MNIAIEFYAKFCTKMLSFMKIRSHAIRRHYGGLAAERWRETILVKNEYRHRILRKILYKNAQFHENPITCNSAALWRSGGGAVAWDCKRWVGGTPWLTIYGSIVSFHLKWVFKMSCVVLCGPVWSCVVFRGTALAPCFLRFRWFVGRRRVDVTRRVRACGKLYV